MHCREAANTARRLLFIVHRAFSELSTAVCGAIARPHLNYAMEANSPNLGAYINHVEWVQRLAKRHVPYVEWLHQLNHASELTSSWPSRCSRVIILRAAFKFGRRVHFSLRRKMRKPPITRLPAILNGLQIAQVERRAALTRI